LIAKNCVDEYHGKIFSKLGKAENSRRDRNEVLRTLERKHCFVSLWLKSELVDVFGIAPNSSVLQTDANLSQLNVRC
jgi:hypothetical protein